jgi:hypothetical protein
MVSTKAPRSLDLARVRQRLDEWRRTRAHPRSPIPKALWANAVALAQQRGVYQTARALHLDYGGEEWNGGPSSVGSPAVPLVARRWTHETNPGTAKRRSCLSWRGITGGLASYAPPLDRLRVVDRRDTGIVLFSRMRAPPEGHTLAGVAIRRRR